MLVSMAGDSRVREHMSMTMSLYGLAMSMPGDSCVLEHRWLIDMCVSTVLWHVPSCACVLEPVLLTTSV